MKNNKLFCRCLCLVLCLVLLISVPLQVNASSWKDKLGSIAGKAGKAAQIYLPELLKKYGLDDQTYELIEKAITDLLQSDWFKNSTMQEKIELVANLLETMGIVDADIVIDAAEKVMSIKLDGHTFGILLEDYTKALLDKFFAPDDSYFEDIEAGSHVNANALILYGLGFPSIERALNQSKNKWAQYGLETTMDNNCTVEDFKHMLKDFDLVIIEEHGNFDWKGVPMIVTKERYTPSNAETYEDDISSGRIYPVITSEGTLYWIHPSFFQYYYRGNQLSGSIVWLGSCSGAKSNALQRAFIDSGAATVIGHSETVYTAYDYCLMTSSVNRLISGDTLNTALRHAQDRWGKNDREYAVKNRFESIKDETATPRMVGDSTVRLH